MERLILYIIINSIFFSCSQPKNYRLQYALEFAENNRAELEKVLGYFENDLEKWNAAKYLIENMPQHFSYSGEPIENIKKGFTYVLKDSNNLSDSLLYTLNSFSYNELDKIYDAKVISSNYLINHIEWAFKHWKNRPWNKNLSFDDFCEYLLPYRLGFEPLENWQEQYEDKYAPILDSLYMGTDVIEAANLLNQHIGKTEKIVFNSDFQFLNPGPLFYLDCKVGSCIDHKNISIYILRSVGIPAMGDFYRISPSGTYGMHAWAVIRDTTGRDISFRAPGLEVRRDLDVEHTKGKVYREYYGKQDIPSKLLSDNEIPVFFRYPYIKDVTENYSGKNILEVDISMINEKYAYLGVHTSWRTTLISMAEVRKEKAIFENVEKGLIYQIFTAKGEKIYPAGYPFLFTSDSTHIFIPDTTRLQKITLYRKFVLSHLFYNPMNYMIGGLLEGGLDKNFNQRTFAYNIQDSVKNIIYKSFLPDSIMKTQFVRFSSPHNRPITLAEITFYTNDGKIPPASILLSGSRDSIRYNNGALANISDGDPLTYYASADISASVSFDLGAPKVISRIDILPRTDDNFIRVGDFYELYYHSGLDGWKSLGEKKAEKLFLEYDNVPTNTLLWLQNHTRGNEEQIFFMKDGEQVFMDRYLHQLF